MELLILAAGVCSRLVPHTDQDRLPRYLPPFDGSESLWCYSKVFADCFGYDYSKDQGSDSGAVSAGQHFLNAKMQFGSDYFIENIGLKKKKLEGMI